MCCPATAGAALRQFELRYMSESLLSELGGMTRYHGAAYSNATGKVVFAPSDIGSVGVLDPETGDFEAVDISGTVSMFLSLIGAAGAASTVCEPLIPDGAIQWRGTYSLVWPKLVLLSGHM